LVIGATFRPYLEEFRGTPRRVRLLYFSGDSREILGLETLP